MDQITVENIIEAERKLFQMSQASHFTQETAELMKNDKQEKEEKQTKVDKRASLNKTRRLLKKSLKRIYKLDPFIDEYGVMRVGGRVRNANERSEVKRPVILPRKSKT